MRKLSAAEQAVLNSAEPQNQNVGLGSRIKETTDYGLFYLQIVQAAGATAVVTNVGLDADPDLVFDFEVIDATVRTESAVTSSAVALRNGTNAFTDAIISAASNVVTRPAQVIKTYNKFYPKSDPVGYAAAKCNSLDSGGATAAARTVTLVCRRL